MDREELHRRCEDLIDQLCDTMSTEKREELAGQHNVKVTELKDLTTTVETDNGMFTVDIFEGCHFLDFVYAIAPNPKTSKKLEVRTTRNNLDAALFSRDIHSGVLALKNFKSTPSMLADRPRLILECIADAFNEDKTIYHAALYFLKYCSDNYLPIRFLNRDGLLQSIKLLESYIHLLKTGETPERAEEIDGLCIIKSDDGNSFDLSIGTGVDLLKLDNRTKQIKISDTTHQLRWEYQLTEFHGRKDELSQLENWLTQPAKTNPISIKLVYGEGGVGKTRLAYHFASQFAGDDWTAGAMGNNSKPKFVGDWRYGKKGILFIIDYPEEQSARAKALIDALHSEFAMPEGKSVRVLLLSRNQEILNDIAGSMKGHIDPIPIALAGFNDFSLAWDVFKNAWNRINGVDAKNQATTLEADLYPILDTEFDAWLLRGNGGGKTQPTTANNNRQITKENLHAAPLFIITLAAYLSGEEGLDDKALLDIKATDLIRKLSKREAKNIENEINSLNRDRPDLTTLHLRGVLLTKAVAAISNGLSVNTLKNMFVSLSSEGQRLLPPDANDLSQTSLWDFEAKQIPAMKPDILAADFLEYCLSTCAIGNEAEWIFSALWVGSIENPNFKNQSAVNNFLRLGRLIYDTKSKLKIENHWPIRSLSECIKNNPKLSAWITLNIDAQHLELHLSDFLIRAAKNAIDYLSDLSQENDFTEHGEDYARILTAASIRFRRAGNKKDAIFAIGDAVKLYGKLYERNHTKYGLGYANSMNTFSNSISEAGLKEEALEYIKLAVNIYISLIKNGVPDCQPYLATSLNNLSNRLLILGNMEDALDAVKYAVEVYRDLARDDFAIYGKDLAESLNNLSIVYFKLGKKDKAKEAIDHSIEKWEVLVRKDYSANATGLACALLFFCYAIELQSDKILRVTDIYLQICNDSRISWVRNFPNTIDRFLKNTEKTGDAEAVQVITEIKEKISQ